MPYDRPLNPDLLLWRERRAIGSRPLPRICLREKRKKKRGGRRKNDRDLKPRLHLALRTSSRNAVSAHRDDSIAARFRSLLFFLFLPRSPFPSYRLPSPLARDASKMISARWLRTRTANDFIGPTGVASSFVAHVRCPTRA